MPRLLGRLWRSGGRRAQVADAREASKRRAADREDAGRRIEEARRRLRQAIPPPEEDAPADRDRRVK